MSDLVVEPQAGRVGQLHIDLYTVVRSSIDKVSHYLTLLNTTYTVVRSSIDKVSGK